MGRRGRVRYPFFGTCPKCGHDWRRHLEEPPGEYPEPCAACLDEMRDEPCELLPHQLPEALR